MESVLLVLLILLVIVFVLAIIVLIVQLRRRDVLQTTIASLMGMLVILVGGLGKPEINGTTKLHLALGSILNIQSDTLSISTSTSPLTWPIAFITIAVLALVCILKLKTSP